MREVGALELAASAWRLIPVELPSTLGRLAYLAWRRDPGTGRYADAALDSKFSGEEIHRLLRSAHEDAFREWLGYSLEEKQADLALYFATLDCPRRQALENWRRLRPYRLFIPTTASEAEEQLFLCDLEALLDGMCNDPGPAAEAVASPPDWRVRAVLDRIERSSGDVRLTLKELSQGLRISEGGLGRLFKQATGLAFREYLLSVRLRRALQLLQDPELTIAHVAAQLGHADPRNFAREFHARLGLNPGEYRLQNMAVSVAAGASG